MKPAADDSLAPTPAAVAVAVERIAVACRPQVILAFGSRARGQARPDSDLDLFVLLHTAAPDVSALRRRLRALLADLPFSKDILVSDPESFAHSRTQLNSVYRDIAEDSVHLWRDGRVDAAAIEEVCR
jgi:predicted nucleotidyltransferase